VCGLLKTAKSSQDFFIVKKPLTLYVQGFALHVYAPHFCALDIYQNQRNMLYFLIIIAPFIIAISYLIVQNNKLLKQYQQIVDKLNDVQQQSGFKKISFPLGINKHLVVTNNSIKRLEVFLMAFEEALGTKRSKVVHNTFKPRKEKLQLLNTRTDALVNLLHKQETASEKVLQ
jgi:hypothetical protein